MLPLSPTHSPWLPFCAHQPLSTKPCSLSLKLAEAQMGTWQGAIWSSPKTLKPPPLSPGPGLSQPNYPLFSALESLSMFTICQLGGLNPLRTESQPAKRGDPWAPSPCLSFLWVGEMGGEEGERQSAISPLAESDRGHGVFAVSCSSQTIVGMPGVEVPGEEGWWPAGTCE